MFPVSSCSCLCPIHWNPVLSRAWRCSWSSTDRRCSNYIWVINNFIAYQGADYIRGFTVIRAVKLAFHGILQVFHVIRVGDPAGTGHSIDGLLVEQVHRSHKFHSASDIYPTMHHFVTEMCTHVHISVTNWCNVGCGTDAFWDMALVHCGIVNLVYCQWW